MSLTPEPPKNDPAAVARLAAGAEERWPACDADYFVGDLCRSYPVAIVAEAGDRAVNKWGKTRLDKAKRAWMRSACQGLVDDGWTPEKPSEPLREQPGLAASPAVAIRFIKKGDPLP